MRDAVDPFVAGDLSAAPEARSALTIGEAEFPLSAAVGRDDVCLAVIAAVEGPSYRRPGAAMVIDATGQHWGALSSGCLERDVIAHARAALHGGGPRRLRYGRGSPFIDITLPCGGTLDIALFPRPDPQMLAAASTALAQRGPAQLSLGAGDDGLCVRIIPQTAFMVFGAGPEAAIFAALTRAAGFTVTLASPDADTIAAAGFGVGITSDRWPLDTRPDAFTSVVMFFHDHDREVAILREALASPAFYVGAQGSLRAHHARCNALLAEGVAHDQLDRLASPFGLIPSTRDARTLAVSVLADVLARAPDTAVQGSGTA